MLQRLAKAWSAYTESWGAMEEDSSSPIITVCIYARPDTARASYDRFSVFYKTEQHK